MVSRPTGFMSCPLAVAGSSLSGANGTVDRIVGGWEWHGTARIQSGRPFALGNVQLVGMTVDELQEAVDARRNPDRQLRSCLMTSFSTRAGHLVSPVQEQGSVHSVHRQDGTLPRRTATVVSRGSMASAGSPTWSWKALVSFVST